MLPILHHLGLTYPVSVTPNEVPKIAGGEASGRVVLTSPGPLGYYLVDLASACIQNPVPSIVEHAGP